MPVVRCPQGDNGLCFRPDGSTPVPTVLVSQGEISLLSHSLTTQLFPDGIKVDSSRALLVGEYSDEAFKDEIYDSVFQPEPSRLQLAIQETMGDDDGILVLCSCGHVFQAPVNP